MANRNVNPNPDSNTDPNPRHGRSLLALLDELVAIGAAGLDSSALIRSLEDIALVQQSGPIPKQVSLCSRT